MQRHDLFTTVHKGLRALLFDTALRVGCTDFGDPGEARAAGAAVARALGFLGEHAEHEDRFIGPVLAGRAGLLERELREEHARLEGLGSALGRLAGRVIEASAAGDAGGAERVSLGRRLHLLLGRYLAVQLDHMHREESEGNRALWAHHCDGELAAISAAIRSSIAPQRMAEWALLLAPALSGPERAVLAAIASETAAREHAR